MVVRDWALQSQTRPNWNRVIWLGAGRFLRLTPLRPLPDRGLVGFATPFVVFGHAFGQLVVFDRVDDRFGLAVPVGDSPAEREEVEVIRFAFDDRYVQAADADDRFGARFAVVGAFAHDFPGFAVGAGFLDPEHQRGRFAFAFDAVGVGRFEEDLFDGARLRGDELDRGDFPLLGVAAVFVFELLPDQHRAGRFARPRAGPDHQRFALRGDRLFGAGVRFGGEVDRRELLGDDVDVLGLASRDRPLDRRREPFAGEGRDHAFGAGVSFAFERDRDFGRFFDFRERALQSRDRDFPGLRARGGAGFAAERHAFLERERDAFLEVRERGRAGLGARGALHGDAAERARDVEGARAALALEALAFADPFAQFVFAPA